jgi:ankyrin repeat protein
MIVRFWEYDPYRYARGLFFFLILLAMGFSACSRPTGSSEGMTPLLLAARAGEASNVQAVLARGASVNETSAYGWTALMFAAQQGNTEVVDLLINAGANPNAVSTWVAKNTQAPLPETTALAEAIKAGHVSIARRLLSHGAQADAVSIALAGGLEDLSLLKHMHVSGAQISDNPGNLYHYSALREACQNGRLANVQWILEQGVPATLGDLKAATGQGHFDIVQVLVEEGVSSGAFSPSILSEAFVHAATIRNWGPDPEANLNIIEYLLAQGADPHYRLEKGEMAGRTALEFLERKCLLAQDLIKQNRYGPKQQAADRAWLEHMESVIDLIKRHAS